MGTQTLSDKEIDQRTTEINARLKAGKVGVRVERRGSCLSLVATLPPRPGSKSKRTKPYQQRIALRLLTNPKGLKQAEEEAKLLGARLATRQFDWDLYDDRGVIQDTPVPNCGEWIEKFKRFIISTNFSEEKPEVADLLWRRRFYNLGLSRLDANDTLTHDALISAAQSSKPNSRARQLHCQNLQRLAEFADVQVDLKSFSGGYSPKDAKPRQIPNREKIEANRELMKTPGWKWVYGVMAAYGLRDHEAFLCEMKWQEEAGQRVLIADVKDGKTGPREVRPLHSEWVDQWNLSEMHLPKVTARTFEEYGERVSRAFKRAGVEFIPYDLRHAYAIRASVEYSLPLPIAAALCGHSPTVHLNKYNRWINQKQQAEAWREAINRKNFKNQPPV
jgi:integrase